MAFQDYLLVGLLVFLTSFPSNGISVTPSHNTTSLNRHSFPAGFIFGSSSSAYQYEGAANEGGKGPSIWDTYTHKHPGTAPRKKFSWGLGECIYTLAGAFVKKDEIPGQLFLVERIADDSNGDVAIDQYHRYKEDVGIMKEIGFDGYRFSISWSRLLPKGKLSAGVNKQGIEYYNNLINELLSKGIKPFATIFHWDLPQTLEDDYGGFLSPRVVDDYRDYAELCFKEFGDRVKHWITLNEPWSFSSLGYGIGQLAPGRCSSWQNLNCTGGDSGKEPYLVTHHLILAHAAAVKVYKQKYQAAQKGVIGISLVSQWMVPVSNAKHNRNAALRALDFMLGWFLGPLTYGDYPHSMRSLVGKRLPKFTEAQSKLVKGSFHFIGLNYYSAYYAADAPHLGAGKSSYATDSRVNLTSELNGIPIGKPDAASTIYLYPRGLLNLLLYTKEKYQNPTIYITENGIDELNNASVPLEVALVDHQRIEYHNIHLWYLNKAIKSGVKVKGYFAWTLLDDFEWYSGYTVRMGLNYVDYKNGLKRYPKLSARWFKNFLKK